MRPSPTRCFFYCLALAGSLSPRPASGQPRSGTSVAPSGWGASWGDATEQQNHNRDITGKFKAAEKAHDYPAQIALCDGEIRKDPERWEWYVIRCGAYAKAKQFDRAQSDLDHVRAIMQERHLPAMGRFHQAQALLDLYTHQYVAAASELQASLDANRNNASAYNLLAWVRATAPDGAVRNGREGVRLAQRAIDLNRKESYNFNDTLAAAYAEANDYPQAVNYEKRALAEAGSEITDAARARDFQTRATARVHLFEQHHPYHAEFEAN